MTIDVFAADEQQAHPVDVVRWAELARQVLAARGVIVSHETVRQRALKFG